MKSLSVTIQMKATEQYFHVRLFVMLYKVNVTPVDKIVSDKKLQMLYSRYHAMLNVEAGHSTC